MKETGVGHMIGKLEVIIEGPIEVSIIADQGQVQGWVQIETGLDVSSVESTINAQEIAQQHTDREVEQIQQKFNMDKDQTLLLMPLMDVDQVRQSICPTEARDNVNLKRVRMVPLHFCL